MTLCHRGDLIIHCISFAVQRIIKGSFHKQTPSGHKKGVLNLSWPLTGMYKYRVCMGVEKTGFVKVAISRASPLTRMSVRRVSTDCIVQFIIPGCYL